MSITVWATPAISNEFVLPDTLPDDNCWEREYVSLCRGERGLASFCVRSPERIRDLRIHLSPSSYKEYGPRVDVRYVLRWWQSSITERRANQPVLVPELLTYSPYFVNPWAPGKNEFPTDYTDAAYLQPMDLQPDYTQQYFVTIKVPDDCQVGEHVIRLGVYDGDTSIGTSAFTVRVLPFELPKPDITYSLFYRAHLHPQPKPWENKTETEYLADLENMREHGITHPTMYEYPDSPLFERAIELRKQAGVAVDPLYLTRLDVGLNSNVMDIKDREILYLKALAQCNKHGIKNVVGYATDEIKPGGSVPQIPYWELARKYGIEILATCYWPNIETLQNECGDYLDTVVLNQGYPATAGLPEIMAKWKEDGTDVWRYEIPTAQMPDRVRRRFGLELVTFGFTGACPYAYCAPAAGSVWDDFDNPPENNHRDVHLALPAKSGPIDTLNYEAYAMAINDSRYAKLLLSLGGEKPDYTGDLDATRDRMIREIIDRLYMG